MRAERLPERVDAARAADRHAGRGPVPAVALQVLRARVQPAQQVERRDRAARAGALLAVQRDQHRGAVVALGDPRRDDPDHARVPALGRQHVGVGRRVLGHQRLGLEADPRLHVAALGVHAVELLRDRLRALAVLGEQQLEPGVRAVQPPGRVQPRPQPEADRGRVDEARVHAGDVHQRAQPRLARAAMRAQALAHEPPVLPAQGHDVRHRGERDQVQVLVGQRRVLARRRQQRLGELVGDAGRAQVRARVAVQPRVHERRVRKRAVGARRVVVGHDHVQPERARRRDLVHRGDRAVHRHEQPRAARRQPLHG